MNDLRPSLGFSLLEVMCAILVLGIGLAGLTQGVTYALSSSKESEVQTAAVLIASGQVEALRAEGMIEEGDTEGELSGALSLYRWKQSVAATSVDGLYEVQVTVENSKSGARIYDLKTLLFDPSSASLQETTSPGRNSSGSNRRRGQRP